MSTAAERAFEVHWGPDRSDRFCQVCEEKEHRSYDHHRATYLAGFAAGRAERDHAYEVIVAQKCDALFKFGQDQDRLDSEIAALRAENERLREK